MTSEPEIVRILKKEEKLRKLRSNTSFTKHNQEQKNLLTINHQYEQLYQNIIEKSPLGIFIVDTRGVVTSFNETFIKMTGYSRDELVDKNISHFPTLRKRDIPKYTKMFKSIINGDVPKPFEFKWVNKEGTLCTGQLSINLIKINNKVEGIQAIINDISVSKETKSKLKDVEERYNSLFNNSIDLIYLYDFKGRFIDANESTLKLLGYKKEELKSLTFSSVVHSSDLLKAFNVVREIKKLGYQKSIQEVKLRRKNGENLYVEFMGSLIYHNGNPYAIQNIARDITDRKINELNIKKRSEDLELINLVNNAINSNKNLDDIIKLISIETGKLFKAFNSTIHLISKDRNFLLMKRSGLDNKNKKMIKNLSGIDLSHFKIPLKERSIYSDVISNNKPKLINSKSEILEMIRGATDNIILKKFAPLIFRKLNIKSTMMVPLSINRTCVGLIDISSCDTFFTEIDLQRFKNVAQQLTIAIDKIILKESKEKSEEKYHNLYERLRDGSVNLDMKGKIVGFNHSFKDMIGYNKDEIYHLYIEDITPKKWHKKDTEIIQKQVLKRDYSDLYEKEFIKKDGTKIPVELTTYLLRNKVGNPEGMWIIVSDITERKKAEELLKESEEKYKNLINLANDGIAIIKNKKIEFLNRRTADMLNYDINELQGKYFLTYVPQDEKNNLNQRYMMRIEGKNIPNVYESQLLRKNGDILPVEINATLINYQGEPADMAIIRDITERKQMEKELEEAKNHFKKLFNTMVDPVVIVDSRGKFLEITDKVEEITGYSKNEILGKNFFKTKLVTPKSKIILLKNLIKRMSGIHQKPYEIEVVTKDGNKLPFEINAAKIEYKGQSADMVVFRDISERKQAEEFVRKSEGKFRNIFENANDGIIYLDKSGRILDVNRKTETMFAGSKNELLGKHFTELKLFSARDISKLISGKTFTLEVIIKNNEGKNLYLECSGSYLKKDGKDRDLLIIARDVSVRKKTEIELKKAHDDLYRLNKNLEKKVEERTIEIRKLLKQKDDFINQLGHDLKNPLNPILNLLPLIREHLSDYKAQDQLDIVMRNVDFMKNLIIKTIELARLNSPETRFNFEVTNLLEESNKIIDANKLLFDEKKIKVINNIQMDIQVSADKLRLEEVFNNLLSNSVKFTEDSGIIRVDAKTDTDIVTVSITDNGIGMNRKQLSHVFDEFYKADPSRHDFDSSGLGMPICKRIVEKHGGRIWAKSPGHSKGTIIYFTLPKSSKNN
jgi:PAS domain S-box-containing protein